MADDDLIRAWQDARDDAPEPPRGWVAQVRGWWSAAIRWVKHTPGVPAEYQAICPKCGNSDVTVDRLDLPECITCPECGETWKLPRPGFFDDLGGELLGDVGGGV